MNAWRLSPVGVLIPTEHKPRPFMWPRPAGWDQLPAEVRAEWDKKWRPVAESVQRERAGA